MSKDYTFPAFQVLDRFAIGTPDYMYPNRCPHVVVSEENLSDDICDGILETFTEFDRYHFTGCNAETTEYSRPLPKVFDPITQFGLAANLSHFQFDLDPHPAAWGQTYKFKGDYKPHTDSNHGQTRKMTVIAMLSDPEDYSGGELVLHFQPNSFISPNKRGTLIAFPPWLLHEVRTIRSGVRQTINMGFWGPPFR